MRRWGRMRVRGLLVVAALLACSKSQAWQVGHPHPQPFGGPPVEVVEELPPFTFEPDVIEAHAAPRPQAASLTALPRMQLSNRCIEAGAVAEGTNRVARKKTASPTRVAKATKRPRSSAPQASPTASTGEAADEAKKFDDATTSASAWIAGAQGRARFGRNLAYAKRCLEGGAPKIAFPMFRALEGQLRKSTLVEWEPTLAVQCIRGYLASKMAVGGGLGAQDERLVDELTLLDPKAMTGLLR